MLVADCTRAEAFRTVSAGVSAGASARRIRADRPSVTCAHGGCAEGLGEKGAGAMIEVVLNDRLGKKIRVKCK